MTFHVVQFEALSRDAERWLDDRCDVRRLAPDADDLGDALREADALLVRTYTRVTEDLLESAPRLRVVGRAGAGLDNIDVAACRERGIEVVYRPDANTQAVVEYVVCLLCDALRPRTTLNGPVDAQTWHRLRADVVA